MASSAEKDLLAGVKKFGSTFSKSFGRSSKQDAKAKSGVTVVSPGGTKTEVPPPTPGFEHEAEINPASPQPAEAAASSAEPVLEPEVEEYDAPIGGAHADDPGSDLEGAEPVAASPVGEAGEGALVVSESAAGDAVADAGTAAEVALVPETEVERLRREAELMEVNAHGALAEASADKIREDAARAAAAAAAAQEELEYAAAEAAEAERRAVIERARPLALRAHEAEIEAVKVRRDAAETEFHAQVLEKKAAALLTESAEFDRHSELQLAQAAEFDADADAARAIHEKLLSKAEEHVVGDLPGYAESCRLEIARLNARIADLREEVAWAESEIQRVHRDGDDWRRIAGRKATEVSRLTLSAAAAREEAAGAREKAREAAIEARAPAELAEVKYAEARELAGKAQELERDAAAQHEEVLAITGATAAPVAQRTEHLRDAADAELRSKELVGQADVVSERIERRLFESQVHADTAARYKAAADAAEADAAFEAGRLGGPEEEEPGADAAAAAAAATAGSADGIEAPRIAEGDADDAAEAAEAAAAAAAAHIDTPPASPTHVN